MTKLSKKHLYTRARAIFICTLGLTVPFPPSPPLFPPLDVDSEGASVRACELLPSTCLDALQFLSLLHFKLVEICFRYEAQTPSLSTAYLFSKQSFPLNKLKESLVRSKGLLLQDPDLYYSLPWKDACKTSACMLLGSDVQLQPPTTGCFEIWDTQGLGTSQNSE